MNNKRDAIFFLRTSSRVRSFRVAAVALALFAFAASAQASHWFDFGAAATEEDYIAVDSTTIWSAGQGYGWTDPTDLLNRDRAEAGDLRRDFLLRLTAGSNSFRVSGLETNGIYLLTVLCGDADYGNHVIDVSVAGAGTLPTLSPNTAQYLQLSATVDADDTGVLDIMFTSPDDNWVVNALTLEPATTGITAVVESSPYSEWDASVFADDPTPNLLSAFDGTGAAEFTPTGLTREDYLVLVGSEVDFWVTHQNDNGAIIDPYAGSEVQYSTPAFANAAAALVVYAGRDDLLEPAALAMDWASDCLYNGVCPGSHDDFFPQMVAHAYRLLAPLVDSSRAATWARNLAFDPYEVYTFSAGTLNWNLISGSGEASLQLLGVGADENSSNWITESWAANGRHFFSPYGLYMEGPMCYDIFPRIFVVDALEQGYDGAFSDEMQEAMDRAAITGLFMQSPWGELPSGGRSAHHQWNEAEQCLIDEVYAARAASDGNLVLAAAYKRAAHLALASMFRWVRPSGEMQIIKNWVDPAERFAYERYSYHSQYNLLPMMMLATAYEYAGSSEDVPEGPAPADTGGFVFQIDRADTPDLPHKIFANAGGTYVEINSFEDLSYDATGLVRVHLKGLDPQLGLTDSLVTDVYSGDSDPGYINPDPSPIDTGAGVSWLDTDGSTWCTLGEMTASQITSISLTPIFQSVTQVVFEVTYSGNLPNVTSVTEHYVVTPDGVALTTELSGYGSTALRYLWPVHSTDGQTSSTIRVDGNTVVVSRNGSASATFSAVDAGSLTVGDDDYSNHNGWSRLATADYPSGGAITLLISSAEPDVNVLSVSPEDKTYDTTPLVEAVIEDAGDTVDPAQVFLLVDGVPVVPDRVFKVATTTTVRGVSHPLALGRHTAGVVVFPGVRTNEWTFSVLPLPAVLLGDMVYVDASSGSSGNTMEWSGSSWEEFNPPSNQSSTADDLWEEEEAYGNGASQNWFESNREGTEDCPQLRTMVSGLPDQTYAVYAYFWAADGQGFSFGAALINNPSGSLPLYQVGDEGVVAADADDFTETVTVVSSDRTLYQVSLGTVSGTTVAVYIDDEADGGYSSSCWFDGIGYARSAATIPADVELAVSNGVPAVFWPESHQGWVLQCTTSLVNGVWMDVSGSESNTSWRAGESGGDLEFFRICYPLP